MAAGFPGLSTLNAQAGLQQVRESQLLNQMQRPAGPDQKEKIQKAAQDFEALLLANWLQQAQQTLATFPGADEDQDSTGADQMMSMGVQSLAGSLAASGGIGIGAMITRAMLHMTQEDQPLTPSAGEIQPANQQFPLNSGQGSADRMAVPGKGSE